MVNQRTEALLQDAAFGEGEVDAAAIDAALSADPSAHARLAMLRQLASDLEEWGAVEPPAGVARTVMATVDAGRARGPAQLEDSTGDTMSKKLMLGIAATVAAALGIYAAMGGSVPPQGAEGTIGAAKRYQGQQITTADVQLGNQATQTFLQSATFDALRRDPVLRKSFLRIVSTPGFAKLASDGNLVSRLTSQAALFQQLTSDAELLRQSTSDAELFRQLTTDAELFRQLSTDAELFRQLHSADAALFAQIASDADLRQLVLGPDFANLVTHASFLAQLGPNAQFYAQLTSNSALFAQFGQRRGVRQAGR